MEQSLRLSPSTLIPEPSLNCWFFSIVFVNWTLSVYKVDDRAWLCSTEGTSANHHTLRVFAEALEVKKVRPCVCPQNMQNLKRWAVWEGETDIYLRIVTASVFVCRTLAAKYHRLGDLNNRSVFFRSCGGRKSKIQVSARLVPSDNVRKICSRPLSYILVVC